VPVEILNLQAEPAAGTLRWEQVPSLWKPVDEAVRFGPILPFQRTRVSLRCEGPGLGTDTTGHAGWQIVLEPQNGPPVPLTAVLSAAGAMQLRKAVQIDGT